jgi:hypothetical protein
MLSVTDNSVTTQSANYRHDGVINHFCYSVENLVYRLLLAATTAVKTEPFTEFAYR